MTEIIGEPHAAREMGRLEALFHRIKSWLIWQRRKLPYLVWWNDEIDMTITLLGHKLREDGDLSDLFTGSGAGVAEAFNSMGIEFDRGVGLGGYDLEFDWSLRGPISCRFRGRTAHPERRRSAPRPELVVDNTKQESA